jgi:hypothetical protein
MCDMQYYHVVGILCEALLKVLSCFDFQGRSQILLSPFIQKILENS